MALAQRDLLAERDVAAPRAEPLDIRHLVVEPPDDHPAAANGVTQVARRLALEQLHAGEDARLVVLRSPKKRVGLESFDVPTQLVPLVGPQLRGRVVALAPEGLDGMLAGAGPRTILHLHGARDPLLLSLTRAFLRRGLPYGITVHGRYGHLSPSLFSSLRPLTTLYVRLLERRVLERARFVHAVSEDERTLLRRLAPFALIDLVPNAAFSSALDAVSPPSPRVGRGPDFPVFGFCGRYEIGHKGLDLLIEGFARFAASGRPGRLVLVGSGRAGPDLSRMAGKLGVGDRVAVHGPLFGGDKTAMQLGWDYFVQSSRFDGMPIGALEAGLLGLPLLLTPATGLAGQLQDHRAGFVIGETSAEGVAAAMERAAAASPRSWSEMSRQAYRMSRAVGDWTVVAERLRTLYGRTRPEQA